ncbi:alpha/beta hydrolase [Amycolatopsis rubida]|uniref:Alpha/beta hydrolase n=1 Tax=Amycolatopsis rubida TaxID=112413 RepID=A0A1I5S3A3_9PSEU|nr:MULTISPECIES: alpha/beta hydrolase [Amycolatopsis]MYW94929.1 alpha/beta fold hydrolase [Amycolatopsis rubida]NEC59916.1 alpha/beta hydrolase [Amycolatopsis rubida]OAP23327.1 Non-heme chloroperoxidase [Amycolatopsis sp. M39]SFP65147.1 Pimeloyl-ACP methyl ester carboxylesterase [Amycolatopsis rubida]
MISRRMFSQAVAAGVATASLAACSARTAAAPAVPAGGHTSFGPLKQVRAGVLNIGYAEAGPADGPVVILLHGWPYDIHSYVDVAPALAKDGYRVIVPYLRGYGTTAFLSGGTVRNGQQSAVASDIIALMDALKIPRAVFGGFDWGSRTVAVLAALWPERVKAQVLVSGYLITNVKAQQQPLPPAAELGWWYQYYFATERGVLGYTRNRDEFNRLIWKTVSPAWHFDDAAYQRTAQSFANPDHVAIVVHNYRWRLGLADGEPQYGKLEEKLFAGPVLTPPTITLASDFDGAAANGAAYRAKFSGRYDHRVLNGIGHNVPQEAPAEFAQAIRDVDRF